MHDWIALRPLVALLVTAGGLLLIFGWMFGDGRSASLAPYPGSAAQQVVKALHAHRYTGAHGVLSESARRVWTKDDLRMLVRSLEQAGREIEDAHGEEDRYPASDTTTATVRVKFADTSERLLAFPCVREHGEWRIASLEALEHVAAQGQQAAR